MAIKLRKQLPRRPSFFLMNQSYFPAPVSIVSLHATVNKLVSACFHLTTDGARCHGIGAREPPAKLPALHVQRTHVGLVDGRGPMRDAVGRCQGCRRSVGASLHLR